MKKPIQGYFNWSDFTVKIGNIHKGYTICKCLKVPDYTITYRERESLGNGWYGASEEVTEVMKHSFIVFKDDEIIGYIIKPYAQENMRSYIQPVTNSTHKPIKDFIKQQSI